MAGGLSSFSFFNSCVIVSVSEKLFSECKNIHSSTAELLRHFWCSVLILQRGVVDTVHTAKVERIASALDQIKNRINDFLNSLQMPSDQHQCDGLLQNIYNCILKALTRYQEIK